MISTSAGQNVAIFCGHTCGPHVTCSKGLHTPAREATRRTEKAKDAPGPGSHRGRGRGSRWGSAAFSLESCLRLWGVVLNCQRPFGEHCKGVRTDAVERHSVLKSVRELAIATIAILGFVTIYGPAPTGLRLSERDVQIVGSDLRFRWGVRGTLFAQDHRFVERFYAH